MLRGDAPGAGCAPARSRVAAGPQPAAARRGCGWRLSHKGQIHGAERGSAAEHTASIMGLSGQPRAASRPLPIKALP